MLAIVDYGLGNVRSVRNALTHIGVESVLTRDAAELTMADGLILPGVGAFGEGSRRLNAYNLQPVLRSAVSAGKPTLGICLGYQLLMRSSNELGAHDGLGFLPMDVIRLPVTVRLPHIGWSEVHTPDESLGAPRLIDGLEGERFYFVHSYGVVEPANQLTYCTAVYGDCALVALVERENVFGTQFHPEKSGEAGLQLLRNFSSLTK